MLKKLGWVLGVSDGSPPKQEDAKVMQKEDDKVMQEARKKLSSVEPSVCYDAIRLAEKALAEAHLALSQAVAVSDESKASEATKVATESISSLSYPSFESIEPMLALVLQHGLPRLRKLSAQTRQKIDRDHLRTVVRQVKVEIERDLKSQSS